MDEALLAKVLDELVSTRGWAVCEIALHNGGETLLHPVITPRQPIHRLPA
jgi:hypothetical protein